MAIGGLALVARLVYGPGFASYDPLWSLIWGRQLADGQAPGFEALPIAPVPHPLANAVAVAVSPAGADAPALLEAGGFLALGLLGWAAFRLGHELYGAAVGAAFALVLVTAPPLVDASLQAVVDVPFLALVLWAAALQARSGDGDGPVVLLALAGLLRPEAWLLSAALIAWRAQSAAPARVARWALVAAAAPALWLLQDLVVTGDPLHSLHVTRTFGGLLEAPKGSDAALGQAPRYLRFFLADPVVWAGLAGVPTALWLLYRRSLLPAALLALGLGGLGILGVAGVPLTYRYAVLPAAMVALFACVAVLGWTALPRGRERSRWRAAGLAGGTLMVVLSVPGITGDLGLVQDRAQRLQGQQALLRQTLERPGTAARLRACPPVRVPRFLLVPEVAYRAQLDPARVTLRPAPGGSTVVRRAGGRWSVRQELLTVSAVASA